MPLGPALTNSISSPQERVQSPVRPQPSTPSRQHPVQPLLSPFVERKQSSFVRVFTPSLAPITNYISRTLNHASVAQPRGAEALLLALVHLVVVSIVLD